MTTPKAQPTVHIDDDRFTVTEWRFQPGGHRMAHPRA